MIDFKDGVQTKAATIFEIPAKRSIAVIFFGGIVLVIVRGI